jgi:hypothetical protein
MIFPTISTLQRLADYATAEDALREIGNASIPTVLPRLIITEKGVRLNIDEEES